ncbi:MAG: DUF4112 domain-containing protein [Candidatus Melainabacteria bacterium]|nr:DUF4112 domain-containing protein [Candidatus Melainabacteria bacterium]
MTVPLPRSVQIAKKMATWMDSRFEIPLTGIRFGLDPLLSLVPGVGDALAALLSAYMMWLAWQLGLPKQVILKMLGNVVLDLLIGLVPYLGDLADVAWKANLRNALLLETAYQQHATQPAWNCTVEVQAHSV